MFLLLAAIASAHGITDAERVRYIEGGPLVYFELGARHMLTGWDHLFFLFGVVFFVARIKGVVALVTAFTIGHSITLLGATWFQIQADHYLVDAVIALSVCYKAFDNLDGFRRYVGVTPPPLLGVVGVFGLIHGFGLSTSLQTLPLGHASLLSRILSFNLGVEAGQVVALVLIVGGLTAWRRRPSFAKFAHVANAALLIAGALLFLFQLHGYVHFTHAEDFPLNEHALQHALQERAAETPMPPTAPSSPASSPAPH